MDEQGWLKPSPRLWTMRVAEVVIGTVVVAIVVGVLLSVAANGTTGVALGAAALVLGALYLWVQRRRYLAWSYQERDEDLVVSRGVMFRRQSVVPYGRMQFVDVTAGPLERMFKLSTVKLHTAAAASDARIPGLEPAEAARLRDRLAELGEAKAAGL
jgi:uncharacterized protein